MHAGHRLGWFGRRLPLAFRSRREGGAGYVECNDCDSVIRTVPADQLRQVLNEMESELEMASEQCPHCGKVNLFPVYLEVDTRWFSVRRPGGNVPPPADGTDPPPDLYNAFEQQLGLKLESTKAPVDILVIDHVEKPSEN